MVLDTSLLNTQQHKVGIKGKVEQSRERSSTPDVVAIKKGAFGSPSTKVANFYKKHKLFIGNVMIYSWLAMLLFFERIDDQSIIVFAFYVNKFLKNFYFP